MSCFDIFCFSILRILKASSGFILYFITCTVVLVLGPCATPPALASNKILLIVFLLIYND